VPASAALPSTRRATRVAASRPSPPPRRITPRTSVSSRALQMHRSSAVPAHRSAPPRSYSCLMGVTLTYWGPASARPTSYPPPSTTCPPPSRRTLVAPTAPAPARVPSLASSRARPSSKRWPRAPPPSTPRWSCAAPDSCPAACEVWWGRRHGVRRGAALPWRPMLMAPPRPGTSAASERAPWRRASTPAVGAPSAALL